MTGAANDWSYQRLELPTALPSACSYIPFRHIVEALQNKVSALYEKYTDDTQIMPDFFSPVALL
jgi:hypothetical protein